MNFFRLNHSSYISQPFKNILFFSKQNIFQSQLHLPFSQSKNVASRFIDFSTLGESNEKTPIDKIILLNNPVQYELTQKYKNSKIPFILTDGGANYFKKMTQTCSVSRQTQIDAIIGDLDSISEENLKYFSEKKVKIIHLNDQNTTDYEKSINYFANENNKKGTVLCLGALGGRIDHTMSIISNTEKFSKVYGQIDIILIGDYSLMYCIRPNIEYHITIGSLFHSKQFGLIAFHSKAEVQTKGFRWNLSKDTPQLEWGKFLSSSNEIIHNQIFIKTNTQIFFIATFLNLPAEFQ